MKVAALAVPVCVLLAACSETSLPTDTEFGLRPQMAATTSRFNVSFPTNVFAFVSCANNGAGDFIVLSGDLHFAFFTTIDNRGGFHTLIHANPQNLTGVGESTQTVYHGVGSETSRINGRVGQTVTSINNFRLIGRGPGNNLHIHENMHVTVNANGEVTAEVAHSTFSCK